MASLPLSSRDRRSSWIGFLLDHIFFSTGLTFTGTATILPAFAARLTDNPVLIGLVGVLWIGGWTLPQIFAANYLSTMRRKLPIAIFLSWISRPVFAVFALFLWLERAVSPTLAFLGLLLSVFYFVVVDSIVGVAWFDMLGKVLSGRERGRLLGLGQTIAGLLSIGAGAAISWILVAPSLSFPLNYAVIFLLADICYMVSLGALYLIREPVEPVAEQRQRMAEYLPEVFHLLKSDSVFRRVNVSRLLVGLTALASPFLAVYALRGIGLPESSIGLFAIAQTLGGVLAGLIFGWLAHRSGSHRVIHLVGGVYLLAPVLAVAAGVLVQGAVLQTAAFSLAFLCLGAGDGAILLGYLNYVLEIAPPEKRPVYIGLTNTLAGLTILYPFIGGGLAGWTGYPAVFLLAAFCVAIGWSVGWPLKASSRPPGGLQPESPLPE